MAGVFIMQNTACYIGGSNSGDCSSKRNNNIPAAPGYNSLFHNYITVVILVFYRSTNFGLYREAHVCSLLAWKMQDSFTEVKGVAPWDGQVT